MNNPIKIVLDYDLIEGITTEMIEWWWENMESTERYKLWHPAHISTEWELRTNEPGLLGSIRIIEEQIGSEVVRLRLRTDPREAALSDLILPGVLVASSLLPDDTVTGQVVHEYMDVPGGVRYRTTFIFPSDFPEEFLEGIKTHSEEETNNFPNFLPELYRMEA